MDLLTYRYKLFIEYDGSRLCGWQRQKDAISVQGVLESAFEQIGFANISIFAAGRTDAGVHALKQVAHCDLNKKIDVDKLATSLNHFSYQFGVVILKIIETDENFHARFSAKRRTYLYKIVSRRAPLILEIRRAWHIPYQLDVSKMQIAANYLTGVHDFNSFRNACCQAKSAIKTLDSIIVQQDILEHNVHSVVNIFVSARSFLHNQVRIIVGALYEVGRGNWEIKRVEEVLESKDRKSASITAPSHGLYLYDIEY